METKTVRKLRSEDIKESDSDIVGIAEEERAGEDVEKAEEEKDSHMNSDNSREGVVYGNVEDYRAGASLVSSSSTPIVEESVFGTLVGSLDLSVGDLMRFVFAKGDSFISSEAHDSLGPELDALGVLVPCTDSLARLLISSAKPDL